MRRGEQTQNVLKGVEQKTKELNEKILPPDVKVHAVLRPQRSRPHHHRHRGRKSSARHDFRAHHLDVFPGERARRGHHRAHHSAGVALRIYFPALTGEAANLLSIGAIDFGIIIDGTIVMVENIYRELGERHGTQYKLHEVILLAARDVDRPIFYSVAVIIAGYLPIYALTGPAGKLFHPMADTMAFALLGALVLTLTVVPVLASYWFKNGVKEYRNFVFEWIKSFYGGMLGWCLRHAKTTMLLATLIFGATLLLVPAIGGEFMPHLDEGALWVRATMPYTISFEEASAFAPKVRAILSAYPQVTEVGSELGRPDDGTDATGFFNCEFYVGLKPYNDPSWDKSDFHNKAALTEAIQKKLESYPGVIFNYTQPAEDAVDEALTGLKSALAVKIFGDDLNVLESKAVEIKNVLGSHARDSQNSPSFANWASPA